MDWRDIEGYEGLYQVSECGNVRRIAGGQGARVGEKKLVDNGHYLKVTLSKNNKQAQRYVHTLVAHAFIGPCPEGLEVNHKDTNKRNNLFTNLEYVTPLQNTQHAIANGRWRHGGEHNGNSRLTAPQVEEIRALDAQGVPRREVSMRYGIKRHTISQIVSGHRWRDRQRMPDVREVN